MPTLPPHPIRLVHNGEIDLPLLHQAQVTEEPMVYILCFPVNHSFLKMPCPPPTFHVVNVSQSWCLTLHGERPQKTKVSKKKQ
jgi:hypothetical protein